MNLVLKDNITQTLFNANLYMPPKKASWTVLYYGNKGIFVAEMPYFC